MTIAARLRSVQERLSALPDLAVDTAIAVALAAVAISAQWLIEPEWMGPLDWQGPTPATVAVSLGANLPLALRRRFPVAVLLTIGVAALIGVPMGAPEHGFGLFIALYTVAAYTRPLISYVALAVFILGNLAALMMVDAVQLVALQLVVFVTAWALGHLAQARRQDAVELARRAAQLEHEREERARLAVIDERGRIARELHDVLAHSVSLMVVQATAAGRIVHSDPERARRAIDEVVTAGRANLKEMRHLVGLLKGSDDPLVPQPDIAALTDLVRDFRQAGLPVDLTIEGEKRALSASVELSAFRIVQEALTNTLKHAGSATAQVRVGYADGALELEVTNTGVVPSANSNGEAGLGHGIPGMRERAALVGGELTYGPLSDGGYKVRARLPTGDAE